MEVKDYNSLIKTRVGIAMLITYDRQKMINVITYFANNVDKLGKIKLFKLLYFLDFEHYKKTGRSVTGLDYHAWKMGPVPVSLFEEINTPKPDMAEVITFEKISVYNGTSNMLKVESKKDFDNSLFTKRELKILEDLVLKYKDTKADNMIEATHLENLPWDKIYNIQNNKQGKIPYDLALRLQEYEDMQKIIKERIDTIESLV